MKQNDFTISGRVIGAGEPAYLIAELSANHRQSLDEAVRLVEAAHQAGADAVKLQTYTSDTITIDSRRPEFLAGEGTLWEGRNLYELYGEAHTPWDWQPKLKEIADGLGMHCRPIKLHHSNWLTRSFFEGSLRQGSR